jgi:hypothetical protein
MEQAELIKSVFVAAMSKIAQGKDVIQELKTINGLTWEEVKVLFNKVLPDGAYKPVTTKSYLTDINSAYLLEALDTAFGPCGIGWGYDPGQLTLTEGTTKQGKPRYFAHYDSFTFSYILVVDGERLLVSIPVSGGSDNDNPGDAMKGAMTNAIGHAASRLLWQMEVYKGNLSHKNAKAKQEGDSKPRGKQKQSADEKALRAVLKDNKVIPAKISSFHVLYLAAVHTWPDCFKDNEAVKSAIKAATGGDLGVITKDPGSAAEGKPPVYDFEAAWQYLLDYINSGEE